MMKDKILITGASGFVGGFIVEKALRQNFEVYAGIRKTSNTQYLKDENINLFIMDFEEEEKLRIALIKESFDYIVLNAGITKAKHESIFFKVNAGFTRKFCKILIEEDIIPKKLIYISSLAAYGPADYQKGQILNSESVPHPVTKYGKSKLQAEEFIKSFHTIPSIIFIPTAVYGPRDKDLVTVFIF